MGCNKCNKCDKDICNCPEPVFSVEAMPDNPDLLRFNVNGKSVWYDFSPVTKYGETATTITVDGVERTFNHYGEKSTQTITARELGAIFHLADFGDVNADSIKDYGILNYRKDTNCPDGCEGVSNGWRADNPIDIGTDSIDYILGSNSQGELKSLLPPADTNKFSYLAWGAQNKAKWATPTVVTSAPNDGTYEYPVYMDPTTGELIVVRRSIQ